MEAYFHIDFGMTASAGEGIAIPSQNTVSALKCHLLGKIPTTILYGKDGDVIKIGESYLGDDRMVQLFKSSFPAQTLDSVGSSKRPGDLISDYLHHLCENLLQDFLQKEGITKEQLNSKWHLTTPACWSERDRLNFQLLARKVVVGLLPSSEVYADISESLASCEFLVDRLELGGGTWAITCDVGGATIDTALCVTKVEGGKTIPQVFPIVFDVAAQKNFSGGVVDIDRRFEELLERFITSMSVTNIDAKREVLRLRYSDQWRHFRHAFQGDMDFTTTIKNDLGSSEDGRHGIICLDGKTITVRGSAVESCFDLFLERLCSEFDAAIGQIKELSQRRTRPTVIALCGGGGVMAYPLKQLKLRYTDIPIKSPSSPEESCLASIVGHRIYRLRQMSQNYLDKIHIGVTEPSSAGDSRKIIECRDNPSRVTVFNFTSSLRDRQVHYFIIHMKGEIRPEQLSVNILTKDPGSGNRVLIWRVEIVVAKKWWRKQEYSITVECTGWGRGSFNFKAFDAKGPTEAMDLISDAYFYSG